MKYNANQNSMLSIHLKQSLHAGLHGFVNALPHNILSASPTASVTFKTLNICTDICLIKLL